MLQCEIKVTAQKQATSQQQNLSLPPSLPPSLPHQHKDVDIKHISGSGGASSSKSTTKAAFFSMTSQQKIVGVLDELLLLLIFLTPHAGCSQENNTSWERDWRSERVRGIPLNSHSRHPQQRLPVVGAFHANVVTSHNCTNFFHPSLRTPATNVLRETAFN